MTMPSRKSIRNTLDEASLRPSKRRGQNFLVNPNTARRIVEHAGVTGADTVIEVGVGLGALTIPIASQAGKVVGIEFDAGIIRYHAEQRLLPENVTLLHQDVLTTDFTALARQFGRLKILANLPYSIASPFLFKLLEQRDAIMWAVLMLQKEVAHRLTAPSGGRDYGVLTVLLDSCATVRSLMHLGPGQFHPRPKVDSSVVRIQFHPVPERATALPAHDFMLLRRIVNAAFQQRRKKLINSLMQIVPAPFGKDALAALLDNAGIDPDTRAEDLQVEAYVALTNSLSTAFASTF